MSYRYACSHVCDISTSAKTVEAIVNTKEKYGCNNCQNTGPNLWLCLQDDCFQIGCSERVNDHSTNHNKDNPTHHIQLNLCTSKLWCYACDQEVFFLPSPADSAAAKASHTISYRGDGGEAACMHRMVQEEEEDEAEDGEDDEDEEEEEVEAADENLDERVGSSVSVDRKRRGAVAGRGRVTVNQHASVGDSSDGESDNASSLSQYNHPFPNSKMGSVTAITQQQKQQHKQQHTYHADSDDSDSSPTRLNHLHSTRLYQQNQPNANASSASTSAANNSNAVRGGLVGLANIGNTCYMNAALQALSNTKPLTGFFLECQQAVHSLSEGRKPGLSRTYQVLMRDMWLGRRTGGYVTPSGILCGIRNVHAMFRGFQQHDTQEFLRNFMDQLHEELKQELVVHPPASPAPPSYSKYTNSNADQKVLANGTALGSPTSSSGISAHAHSTGSYGSASSAGGSPSSNYDSSEGEEYETCDSGVSERSSLSDDTDRSPINVKGSSTTGNKQQQHKRRLSRSGSPGRRMRARKQNNSGDQQSSTNCSSTKTAPIKYRSIISDIFDGKLLSSVQCLTCDRVSSRVETFQDLSLPIPSSRDHLVVIHGRGASVSGTGTSLSCGSTAGGSIMEQPNTATSLLPAIMPSDGWLSWLLAWLRSWFYGPAVSLHDCLAAFFSRDELKGDNMYSCERCNKLRNGIKYSKVLQLPEVLCIHLKRFRHELMYSSKISAVVAFPLRSLDMRPYLHEKCSSTVTTYHLFAVICHHGTAGGGHYTCYALNNGQWYEFDDQYVTATTLDQVAQCQAYVLFYAKCTAQADQVKSVAMTLSLATPSSATPTQSPPLGHDCSACSVNATATGTKPHVGDLGCVTKEILQGEHEGVIDPPPRLCYVSKQWLSRFKTCAEPGPIDNSDFLCRHGNVDPLRERDMDKLATVFPAQVYEYLLDRFGGCPLIPCNSSSLPNQAPLICPRCTTIHQRINAETDQFIGLNEACKRSELTHFLSTNWFRRWQAWVQRRTPDQPGPIEKGGRLLQGQVVDYDCAEVNEAIWSFFYDIYGAGPDVHVALVAPSDNSLRQSHVPHNQSTGHETIVNSESDSELEEEDNDDENHHVSSTTVRNHHMDNMDEQEQEATDVDEHDNDSMDVDDTPQFVIPSLRRDATMPTAGNVNKRLYGRGEPEQIQVTDMEMETGMCNGDAVIFENHSSAISGAQMQTAQTLTVTTETKAGRSSEKMEKSSKNNRYRRRRMLDT